MPPELYFLPMICRFKQRPCKIPGRRLRTCHIPPLEEYSFCSHISGMLAPAPRRTDAAKLRQTISQLLDQLYAVEQCMDMFHRKGDPAELGRAAENFNEMLGQVDALGDMITE